MAANGPGVGGSEWQCAVCTLLNPTGQIRCEACGTPSPVHAVTPARQRRSVNRSAERSGGRGRTMRHYRGHNSLDFSGLVLESGGGQRSSGNTEDGVSGSPRVSSSGRGRRKAPLGNRGAAANHLLGFYMPDRGVSEDGAWAPVASSRPSRPPRALSQEEVDRYIVSTLRFVVEGRSDRAPSEGLQPPVGGIDRIGLEELPVEVSVAVADSDVALPWERVLEVVLPPREECICPICLASPPDAPVVTPCGHAFCRHCALRLLLRFAEAEDLESVPCPVCTHTFRREDLRPGRVLKDSAIGLPPEGSRMKFTLCARERDGSTLVSPVCRRCAVDAFRGRAMHHASHLSQDKAESVSVRFTLPSREDICAVFSKLSVGQKSNVAHIAEKELRKCAANCAREGDTDGLLPVIYLALQDVWAWRDGQPAPELALLPLGIDLERRLGVNVKAAPHSPQSIATELSAWPTLPTASGVGEAVVASGSLTGTAGTVTASLPSKEQSVGDCVGCGPVCEGCELIYQASDGSFIFLEPIVCSMLCTLHKRALPHSLDVKVLRCMSVTQTAETRRRHKHAMHIPLGASFNVVCVDMTELAPPEVLSQYSKHSVGNSSQQSSSASGRRKGRRNKDRPSTVVSAQDDGDKSVNRVETVREEDFPSFGGTETQIEATQSATDASPGRVWSDVVHRCEVSGFQFAVKIDKEAVGGWGPQCRSNQLRRGVRGVKMEVQIQPKWSKRLFKEQVGDVLGAASSSL